MSIDLAAAVEIYRAIKERRQQSTKISVLCFSVQVLCFSKERFFDITGEHCSVKSHSEFLSSIGATKVVTTNFSTEKQTSKDYLDLNGELEDRYLEGFDLVLDMGVIQHCSSPFQVLYHAAHYTKLGGQIIHSTFCNNKFDQAFFQLSPSFFYDHYTQNQIFKIDTIFIWKLNFGLLKVRPVAFDTYHSMKKKEKMFGYTGLVVSIKKIEKDFEFRPAIHHIYLQDDINYDYIQRIYINYTDNISRVLFGAFRRIRAKIFKK